MSISFDIQRYDSCADLPATWDAHAPHFFMRTAALQALERTRPCGQQYCLATHAEGLVMAVTYRHKMPLLVGRGRNWFPVPVQMVGVPCSLSCCGYHVEGVNASVLAQISDDKGLTVVMNAQEPALDAFASGSSLPSWILPVRWASFAEYLASLRSSYRRRIQQAQRLAEPIVKRSLDRSAFDASHYRLYEAVYARSRYRLEKLELSFFREFPADLDVFEIGGQPIGFVQTLLDGDRLTFMFGGMDYRQRDRYDVYWNLLLHVLEKGIQAGCREIDFGQTAGSTKARLGALPVSRWFHARHASSCWHAVLAKAAPFLSYRGNDKPLHVFREQKNLRRS